METQIETLINLKKKRQKKSRRGKYRCAEKSNHWERRRDRAKELV